MDGKGQLSLSLLNRFELCFIKLYCLRDGGVLVTRMSSGGASNEAANPLGLSQVSSPSPGTWGPLWLLFLTAEDCILVMKLRHANRKITDTVGKKWALWVHQPAVCSCLYTAFTVDSGLLHLLLSEWPVSPSDLCSWVCSVLVGVVENSYTCAVHEFSVVRFCS